MIARLFGAALSLATIYGTAEAETLRLPAGRAAEIRQQIAAQCPECGVGFTACGSADVGYGRRFAAAALQGKPRRGYLVSFVMNGDEFRALARRTQYASLIRALVERFAGARLVVIEDAFDRVRVLPAPTVRVVFPEALHQCISDEAKPWGCCVGDCGAECCEKGLGSPSVKLTWDDGGDEVVFTFSHTPGVSTLVRAGVVYYCLTDAAAALQ